MMAFGSAPDSLEEYDRCRTALFVGLFVGFELAPERRLARRLWHVFRSFGESLILGEQLSPRRSSMWSNRV